MSEPIEIVIDWSVVGPYALAFGLGAAVAAAGVFAGVVLWIV